MPSTFSLLHTAALLSNRAHVVARRCPRCSIRRILHDLQCRRQSQKAPNGRDRYASTLVSSTAVNATKDIPLKYQTLHDALKSLKKDARNYVDLSKVSLAIRGLESRNSTVRLAVLGLQSFQSAIRLARLLLADPLSPLEPWEEQLLELHHWLDAPAQGVVVRYGPSLDLTTSRTASPLLQVPARLLHLQNLELFISTTIAGGNDARSAHERKELQQAALVPMTSTKGSFAGNVSMIRHPVHLALILADGLVGCSQLYPWLKLNDTGSKRGEPAITLALDLKQAHSETEDTLGDVRILDLSAAEKALEAFRTSKDNAIEFEKGWREGGLLSLNAWVFDNTTESEGSSLNPATARTLRNVIEETEDAITGRESEKLKAIARPAIASALIKSLDSSVKDWARQSHTELRNDLELTHSSRTWARLRWWKLPWRVDDVTMILEDLLTRRWLVQAEKGVYWLAGRIQKYGSTDNDVASRFTEGVTTVGNNYNVKTEQSSRQNWPTMIHGERESLKAEQVPAMQVLAQSLVLQTASFLGVSGALSIAPFFLLSSWTLYEAGAVASLGLAWSLRRMQKIWESSRQSWLSEFAERGRITLRQTEAMIGSNLALAQEHNEDDFEVEDRRLAREAIAKARLSLDALLQKPGP